MTTYLNSLNQALRELLKEDEGVYIAGEDVRDPYGGAFKVTKNLSLDFSDKVLTTPISEAAIVGMATGMAMRGLRPIVEIMFGDFITLAMDQLINHSAKFSMMYALKVNVPLVVRTPMGGGRGYGPTHSQSLEKIFFGIPGLSVVAPSHFHNPGDLLKNAVLKDDNPVLFIEHKSLYSAKLILKNRTSLKMSIQSDNNNYPTVIIRNYDNENMNPDVILITYGGLSLLIEDIMQRMFQEEIRIITILPSLISKPPLKIINGAIRGCKNVITIEEGTKGFNWGSEIESLLYESLGDDCPKIYRIAAANSIIPAARHLENAVLPSVESIENIILEVVS